MNNKELKQLPANDEFAQCMRKIRNESNEIIKKRKQEIQNCNHLFVLLRKGQETYGCHSTDYYKEANEVECVHCGLTNRFKKLETILFNDMPSFLIPLKYRNKIVESEMFDEIFKAAYLRGGKTFNNSVLNLISNEILFTYHPGLLYELAIKIYPTGTNEEIFKVMKILNSLETEQERIRLQTQEQASSLLERYYNSKPKILTIK